MQRTESFPPHIFWSLDLLKPDNSLMFVEKIDGKNVEYTYGFGENILFMVVKDFSDQPSGVRNRVMQEMEKNLSQEFGTPPLEMKDRREVFPGSSITYELKTQRWENELVIAQLESGTRDIFLVYHKQIVYDVRTRSLGKLQKESFRRNASEDKTVQRLVE